MATLSAQFPSGSLDGAPIIVQHTDETQPGTLICALHPTLPEELFLSAANNYFAQADLIFQYYNAANVLICLGRVALPSRQGFQGFQGGLRQKNITVRAVASVAGEVIVGANINRIE
jgi:hypothetical protein